MMRQDSFHNKHNTDWLALQANLQALDKPSSQSSHTQVDLAATPRLYRNICHHLALSRSRAYSPHLIEHLLQLAIRGHQAFYSQQHNIWHNLIQFITQDYPQLFRQQWQYMLAAGLLFLGAFLSMMIIVQLFPETIFMLINFLQVMQIDTMYSPEVHKRIGQSRNSGSDFWMLGYYIKHNISIGFQTFAGGLFFGIGTIYYLLYNGLVLGAIASRQTTLGHIDTFWGFVSGHSAPEFTAIMLSGAAGLMLGWALLAPGNKSRLRALQDTGRQAVKIIYGAVLLFLLAAFIEAFWSSMSWINPGVKYVTGIGLWIILWGYLLFAKKTRAN